MQKLKPLEGDNWGWPQSCLALLAAHVPDKVGHFKDEAMHGVRGQASCCVHARFVQRR